MNCRLLAQFAFVYAFLILGERPSLAEIPFSSLDDEDRSMATQIAVENSIYAPHCKVSPQNPSYLESLSALDPYMRILPAEENPFNHHPSPGHKIHYNQDTDTLYISLSRMFDAEVNAVESALFQWSDARMVVLDLSECAGGDVEAAISICGFFIGPRSLPARFLRPSPSGKWSGSPISSRSFQIYSGPIEVRHGRHTASAAELLMLGLNGRATFRGSPTKGKTAVQDVWQLPSGRVFILTTKLFGPLPTVPHLASRPAG
jgi:hypothetical protein